MTGMCGQNVLYYGLYICVYIQYCTDIIAMFYRCLMN